ncbi:MAG TPA: hypothetical protein VFA65_10165 [Bryobacteraceae bacterium]|nr:hypothetical protein [Bryobacteraceae bacterium]
MSKKNRSPWRKAAPAPQASAVPEKPAIETPLSIPADFSPISPAQLAANRANAQLSTGPRTAAGLAKSSQNAVKSGLTGRTVLLPTDDVEEYARFLAGIQRDLKPLGQVECELVQIVVDCFWRQRRIQALEFALYAHGHDQFADAFEDCPEQNRYNKILLQTDITYAKQFRNYQIQEARLDRKRAKAMAELQRLQTERKNAESTEQPSEPQISDDELFATLDAALLPPFLQSVNENGFVFSNAHFGVSVESSATPETPLPHSQAA